METVARGSVPLSASARRQDRVGALRASAPLSTSARQAGLPGLLVVWAARPLVKAGSANANANGISTPKKIGSPSASFVVFFGCFFALKGLGILHSPTPSNLKIATNFQYILTTI